MSRYLASAALALCLCATAVQAQPRQMHVSLAGLDLSKPSDVQALNRRIHKAAVDVCGTAQYQPGQGINQFVASLRADRLHDAFIRQSRTAS